MANRNPQTLLPPAPRRCQANKKAKPMANRNPQTLLLLTLLSEILKPSFSSPCSPPSPPPSETLLVLRLLHPDKYESPKKADCHALLYFLSTAAQRCGFCHLQGGCQSASSETFELEKFSGAVVITTGGTQVRSAVCTGSIDYSFKVDYEDKMLCMPLEEKEDEWEILCSRLIDHCIRPLFPTGLYRHIEVKSTVLSSGGIYCPDVMAVNATSAALMLSDIPWNGPIGVIRVARIEGKFIVHPTMHELSCSDLNLVYACTKSCTMMIDGNSELITEKDLQTALFLAHSKAVKYLCPQFQLAKMAGQNKRREKIFIPSRRIIQRTRSIARKQLERFFTKNIYNKFERGEAFHKHITPAVQMKLYDEGYGGKLPLWRHLPLWRNAVDMVRKEDH